MLTKEQIGKLNDKMLNLGQPDQRDYVGYNQPDYMKMRGLGYMPADGINDLMAYAMLDSLQHYKNTQLINDKADIEETLEYYTDKAKALIPTYQGDTTMFKRAYIDYCVKNKIHDFMQFISMDKDSITIHINGFVKELNEFKNEHKDKIRAVPEIKDGKQIWHTKIMWDFLDEYLDKAINSGRGYIPDENLQEIIDKNKLKMIEEKEKAFSSPLTLDLHNVSEDNICELKMAFRQGDPRIAGIRGYLFDIKDEYGVKNIGKAYDGSLDFQIHQSKVEDVAKLLYNNFKINVSNALKNNIKDYRDFVKSHYGLQIPPEDKLPFKPYPFQIEDAQQIISVPRMVIGHEMGLGKTFIATLVGQSINGKKLVIGPETLRLNWKREILKIYPDADVKCCTNKSYEVGKDWTIMGYRTAVKYENLLSQEDFACAFIDEAHNIKAVDNWGKPTSQRAKAVMNLCDKIKYVYPMTGTPIPTHNKDLYNLLTLVRSPIATQFWQYANKYCAAYNNGYGLDATGNSNSEDLHAYLNQKMVRRLRDEVLPDLKKVRNFIPLDVMTKKIEKLEDSLSCTDSTQTFMGLCMKGRNMLSDAKAKAVIEYAEELADEGRSVVIVTSFDNTLNEIQKHFGCRASFIRGGMSDTQKQKAIDDFQSGKTDICAMNIIAGGVGVTLTKSHDMIMVDFDWTPANMLQAEDRICRAGQTNLCNINYFYCQDSKLDEYFVQMLSEKMENIDKAVDDKGNSLDLLSGFMASQGLKRGKDIVLDTVQYTDTDKEEQIEDKADDYDTIEI